LIVIGQARCNDSSVYVRKLEERGSLQGPTSQSITANPPDPYEILNTLQAFRPSLHWEVRSLS